MSASRAFHKSKGLECRVMRNIAYIPNPKITIATYFAVVKAIGVRQCLVRWEVVSSLSTCVVGPRKIGVQEKLSCLVAPTSGWERGETTS